MVSLSITLAASAFLSISSPPPGPTASPPSAVRFAQSSYETLAKDYDAAVKTWRDEVRAAAKQSKDKEAEVRAKHPVREYWPRMEELVRSGDGQPLVWMTEACEDYLDGRSAVVDKKSELVDKLLKDHANAPWAASATVDLLGRQRVWFDEAWVRTKLAALAESSKDKEVSASAYYALAQRLTSSKASDEDRKKGEALFARIESEFAGSKAANELAQRKAAGSYEIGGIPADFDAKDVDGTAFKLTDYRGKVVLLDFWGFW